MKTYVPIHGTWARRDHPDGGDWWQRDSPFAQAMREHGWQAANEADPYVWSGHIGGVSGWLHKWFSKAPDNMGDWIAAGHALRWYLRCYENRPRVVIAHSHGMVPALRAALLLPIDILVTIGSPIRDDHRDLYRNSRENIGVHLHVYDEKFDLTGSLGSFGDSSLDWWWNPNSRRHPYATNLPLADIGHSGPLHDRLDKWFRDVLPIVEGHYAALTSPVA